MTMRLLNLFLLMYSNVLMSGEITKPIANENTVVLRQENVICKLEYVFDMDATVLGMRIEVFNRSETENLVLVVREHSEDMFKLTVKDASNDSVIETHAASGRGKTSEPLYRYDCVIAQTSHSWFIPIPSRYRPKGDSLTEAEIPSGTYKLKLSMITNYFKTNNSYIGGYDSKKLLAYPDNPEYRDMVLTFPEKLIVVDPAKLKKSLSKADLFEMSAKK